MEEIQILRPQKKAPKTIASLAVVLFTLLSVACTTKQVIEDDDPRFKDINEEFSKVVTVDTLSGSPIQKEPIAGPTAPVVTQKPSDASTDKNIKKKQPVVKPVASKEVKVKESPGQPPQNVLQNRRPLIDPFRENEKIVLSVNYFNMEAGDLSMMVGPYKNVNGRKSYTFSMEVITNKMFSLFYRVKNTAETLVDFDSLIPLTYSSQSNESDKRKEVRVFFDWQKNFVTHWEKSIKGSDPEKKKKIEWAVEPFSQNFISALYYLRTYPLEPGKKFAFQVVDAGKNYVFHAEVLRREKINTVLGELNTVVVKPTFEMGDQFKQTGENLIWITDDDRKFIVRVESKIKIGTLVGKLKLLERGQ